MKHAVTALSDMQCVGLCCHAEGLNLMTGNPFEPLKQSWVVADCTKEVEWLFSTTGLLNSCQDGSNSSVGLVIMLRSDNVSGA